MTKPSSLQIVAIAWIISGILTILWGFGLVVAALTSFVGILCLPLSIYPFVVGILELVYGIRLASSPTSLTKAPVFVSVMEIFLIFWGDVFGLIAGIVTLVLLKDEETTAYFMEQSARLATEAQTPIEG
jgi:hypothetical protein